MSAIETTGLGKRYGRDWALRDCSMVLPAGRVIGLVGPNGAGKSTLLQLAVGLTAPSSGTIRVLGERPAGWSRGAPNVGFVAQDHPLYLAFTVAELLRMGAKLNPRFDRAFAERRLGELSIPLERVVGRLSGGQQSQVALALALAKRPRLLILDEPVASLDPLARRDFLGVLMAAAAEDGMTVVLSSHLLDDLERICDYLIVLSAGRVQLQGDVEELLADHRLLTGPARAGDLPPPSGGAVVESVHTERQTQLLVYRPGPTHDPNWRADSVSMEDLVLAYLGDSAVQHRPRPVVVTAAESRTRA